MREELSNFQDRPRIFETTGTRLANDGSIELVRPAVADQLALLHWDGKDHKIGRQFQQGLNLYHPPFLPASVLAAIRFACEPADYGSPTELFWNTVGLFPRYMGFSRELAAFMSRIVFCSWFPEWDVRPLTLCISGLDMDRVMRLFRLLHALCRHPLVVAELSFNLPLSLCLTLLVNGPTMSPRMAERWRTSNYFGAFVPGTRGTLRNVSCSKIIYCESEHVREVWGSEAVDIVIAPTTETLPPLTESEATQIAAEFQGQLLLFRLHHLSEMYQSAASSSQPGSGELERGGSLPACIAKDPEILKALAPLFEAREQDLQARRSLEPPAVIVEVIWPACHQGKEITTTQVATWVTALLRSRGEIQEYDAKRIGWALKKLGLDRHDNGKNRVLRFSSEMRRRVHQLAAQFGLTLPKFPGCPDCGGPQLIVP